ncbi:DNA/RNA nuclease SfsA [Parashewanella spongiae]|uniref:Sugar fermentation stimulation protein homolog n=1 Tax=Parashewanella spongiae TaxID=342950 RepID=A0A3A6TBU6_9GAMM|nr:DNA/RNA nuclease SfsA [Parashewanella spongiae]MCL1076663.1 DNA/RNA nuclease SfsA [Parashewanella spongiae]RJY12411.1 DNA/RNA nuclease SfsA [Parashewanella spongiae]
MEFEPGLECGVLIKRYKRFLADVRLQDGSEVTIHCPNTGSMKNCQFPDQQVWFSTSDNPKRKYSRTWELMETPVGDYIGINTGRANQLAADAINTKVIQELVGYHYIKREVKYGSENSRIDILLTSSGKPDCYVEVKSCTLLEDGKGYFPDSVTTRGQKHLRELIQMVENGHRAVLLFVVQHTGIDTVSPAKHIDPAYASLFYEAMYQGVEVLAYKAALSPTEFVLTDKVNIL